VQVKWPRIADSIALDGPPAGQTTQFGARLTAAGAGALDALVLGTTAGNPDTVPLPALPGPALPALPPLPPPLAEPPAPARPPLPADDDDDDALDAPAALVVLPVYRFVVVALLPAFVPPPGKLMIWPNAGGASRIATARTQEAARMRAISKSRGLMPAQRPRRRAGSALRGRHRAGAFREPPLP
jgi:hypothetical protein